MVWMPSKPVLGENLAFNSNQIKNAPPLLGQRGDVVYAYSLVQIDVDSNGVNPEPPHLSTRWRGRRFLHRWASQTIQKKAQTPNTAKVTKMGEFWQASRTDLINSSKSII